MNSPNDNLTFRQAKSHAFAGMQIRRPHWDNSLRHADGDTLEFVIAVQVYGSAMDRSYEPTPTERNAHDWIAFKNIFSRGES